LYFELKEIDSKELRDYLNKIGQGDLAWGDDSLITFRNSKIYIEDKNRENSLSYIAGKYCVIHKLRPKIKLPISLICENNKHISHFITIHKTTSDGIYITYKKLNSEELKHYLKSE
jgi:hypothetical protein